MFSVLPFGVLVGSLLFGPIVDRFGYKILLSVSCILLSAGFGGIAVAGNPVCSNYTSSLSDREAELLMGPQMHLYQI